MDTTATAAVFRGGYVRVAIVRRQRAATAIARMNGLGLRPGDIEEGGGGGGGAGGGGRGGSRPAAVLLVQVGGEAVRRGQFFSTRSIVGGFWVCVLDVHRFANALADFGILTGFCHSGSIVPCRAHVGDTRPPC